MEVLRQWQAEIASGRVRVVFVDESHLLWGDVCGYGWSRRNQRVDWSVPSPRERQTYYGALDYLSKQFVVQEYDAGNTENTIEFLQYLQSLDGGQARLIVIWDGASYHRSKALRAFLEQVNRGLAPEEWAITCIQLAPYAPEQNPVEDIWLQGKRVIRQFCRRCRHFASVKMMFRLATHYQTFLFEKAFMYGYCSYPI